jgi:hypothetical protein
VAGWFWWPKDLDVAGTGQFLAPRLVEDRGAVDRTDLHLPRPEAVDDELGGPIDGDAEDQGAGLGSLGEPFHVPVPRL